MAWFFAMVGLTAVIVSILGGMIIAWAREKPWATSGLAGALGLAFCAVASVLVFALFDVDAGEQGTALARALPVAGLSAFLWIPGALGVSSAIPRGGEQA
ncbi:hypothetical protein IV417_18380 [Alphaproteobacteria bacterium KMM 3653]|uniref:Uncharacterized protein n=1 Tax=Harenicola maris TaxID=2841044 RepID=A0AAP2CRV7_9RHOB|nr:hypothetical protein [Harenicola maris]